MANGFDSFDAYLNLSKLIYSLVIRNDSDMQFAYTEPFRYFNSKLFTFRRSSTKQLPQQ